MTKDAVLKRLAETTEYISGEVLASELGVSRNAVWKAVKSLENDGFIIEKLKNKGYRLSKDSNRLSAEIISANLKEKVTVYVYDEVGSTNSIAKEMAAQNVKSGTAVIAESQTDGRGRLGRKFVSPHGTGIYMSIIIRPDFEIETAPLMTTAVAVAVAEAVEKLSGEKVSVKWVNDIYINGKKICGILTEASMGLEMKKLDYAVIGIGINVRSLKGKIDSELSGIASSIEEETGKILDRNILCAEILKNVSKRISSIETKDFLLEYRKRELLTGNMITYNINGSSEQGFALGIDDNANLIVKDSQGNIRQLGAGEANLLRIENRC